MVPLYNNKGVSETASTIGHQTVKPHYDPKHGHWWLELGSGLLVGYWPSFLFSHLQNHASMIQFGGEIVNSRLMEFHTSTQMGSGHFADEGFGKASYFRNLQLVNWDNNLIPLSILHLLADNPNCYDIKAGKTSVWGSESRTLNQHRFTSTTVSATTEAGIAQLQNQNNPPSRIEPKPSQKVFHRVELVSKKLNDKESGTGPAIMKMLEELTKLIESGEKKIEANNKKMETYNSRVDKIPGVPPILKGLDSKKFMQKPFPPGAAPKPIPKKFRVLEIPKYNGTTDPNEHVTSYTWLSKGMT
uniref:Uncharacterized protein LOC104223326 n=1 Tax=Nicotiana sylvestris TaxID=4096 RepID=A0A1U7WEH7_NICSY|nr:PREDICTED: uncharacterized protein LOC104223326 [Nicotiana sylvestris]